MALRWATNAIRQVSGKSIGETRRQLSTYALPSLKYKYEALEPHIDATTMQVRKSLPKRRISILTTEIRLRSIIQDIIKRMYHH